jgi:NTP pyrophosphatase (non-canonical NTP hydrolase)
MKKIAEADLSFHEIREINVARCVAAFPGHRETWGPAEWGCAVAGEAGELANKCKKVFRGDPVPIKDIADELSDVILYADLLADHFGIDLAAAIRSKFNEVSEKKGASQRL